MKSNSIFPDATDLRPWVTMVLLLGAVSVYGDEGNALSFADANTSAAHQSSKTFYLEKADAARNNASEHRELRGKYVDQGLTIIARHCAAIAKRYDEIAESYDMIADGHDNLSKDGRSGLSELHGNHPPTNPSP